MIVFILLVFLLISFKIRRLIKTKDPHKRFHKKIGIVVIVVVSFSFWIFFDWLNVGRARVRVSMERIHLKEIINAVNQYRTEKGMFPSGFAGSLENVSYPWDTLKKSVPLWIYRYKEPPAYKKDAIICWVGEPVFFSHDYMPWRRKTVRAVGRLDGTIEIIAEQEFQELARKYNLTDQ